MDHTFLALNPGGSKQLQQARQQFAKPIIEPTHDHIGPLPGPMGAVTVASFVLYASPSVKMLYYL